MRISELRIVDINMNLIHVRTIRLVRNHHEDALHPAIYTPSADSLTICCMAVRAVCCGASRCGTIAFATSSTRTIPIPNVPQPDNDLRGAEVGHLQATLLLQAASGKVMLKSARSVLLAIPFRVLQ